VLSLYVPDWMVLAGENELSLQYQAAGATRVEIARSVDLGGRAGL